LSLERSGPSSPGGEHGSRLQQSQPLAIPDPVEVRVEGEHVAKPKTPMHDLGQLRDIEHLIVVAGPPNKFGSHAIGLEVVRNYESGDEL
jgi:hypothetical protein